jgi:large subunit ribosomal protein L10
VENPRPEKVATVSEIAGKLSAVSTVFVSEYRGLTVGNLAELRRALRDAGGEHKVYKNTLARLAAEQTGNEALVDMLVGPSALTFVNGDAAAVAKVLREFAKTNPLLVVKGGALSGAALSAKDVEALADLPPREVLLAQLAGAIQAPLVKTAGLLQALPRNMAYGLKALVDQKAAA